MNPIAATPAFAKQASLRTSTSINTSVILSGYLIALTGALSFFSIAVLASCLTLIAGLMVVALASDKNWVEVPPSWRSALVWLGGSAVLFGIWWLTGDDGIRDGTPHPAAYQIAWLVGLGAFRHVRQLFPRSSEARCKPIPARTRRLDGREPQFPEIIVSFLICIAGVAQSGLV